MFFKKIFSWFKPADGDSKFWKRYQGRCDRLFVETEKGREPVMEDFLVRIVESKTDPFTLDLVLFQSQPGGQSFAFPLEHEMRPSCALNKVAQSIEFALRVKKDTKVVLEFAVNNEEFDEAGMFREVLARALYQTAHRKSWRECKSEEEILGLIKIKDKKPAAAFERALKAKEKVCALLDCRFAEAGLFGSLDLANSAEEPAVLAEAALLVLSAEKDFGARLLVFDEEAKQIYARAVDQDLYYYSDEVRQNLVWMDQREGHSACLCFNFAGKCSAELRLALSGLLLEAQAKMPFHEILEKGGNDWEQFYLKKRDSVEGGEAEDAEQFKGEKRNLVMDLEYNALGLPPSQNPLQNIRAFAQAKRHKRAFISAENAVGLFRFEEESGRFDFEYNLPVVETLDGRVVRPDKIQVQEGDAKLVLLDRRLPESVFYYDFQKAQIVSEFRPAKQAEVKDVSLFGGKEGALGSTGLILSVAEREINLIDPRAKSSSVQSKAYKSNPRFSRVLGVREGHFAVGSATGEVRLYNAVGGNSKNVIPAPFGDRIKFMDASKDGRLLLFTFARFVMLLATQKNCLDGFEYTFKKDDKPAPRLLKIHPSALAKLGVAELDFGSAKFDEKADAGESYIVGISGDVIALWNLSKIMKGHYVTSNVKRTGERIVEGEFRYNVDDLITAFADKLTIQHTEKDG